MTLSAYAEDHGLCPWGSILLVEQNARKALAAADRGYVLETGEIVLSDSSEKLATNPQVKKAYLGGT